MEQEREGKPKGAQNICKCLEPCGAVLVDGRPCRIGVAYHVPDPDEYPRVKWKAQIDT